MPLWAESALRGPELICQERVQGDQLKIFPAEGSRVGFLPGMRLRKYTYDRHFVVQCRVSARSVPGTHIYAVH